MAEKEDSAIIYQIIQDYIVILKENAVSVWRLYLYGSWSKGTFTPDSDIDLAVFLDQDELDGFEEDALLMKLRRKVDLRIEPHAFARSDFDLSIPLVKEIVEQGERIV
jgi:predicted nucleotidyltransferase